VEARSSKFIHLAGEYGMPAAFGLQPPRPVLRQASAPPIPEEPAGCSPVSWEEGQDCGVVEDVPDHLRILLGPRGRQPTPAKATGGAEQRGLK